MKPTLLVLAAGMGSRYGGLKQLDEVGPNGETIMDYSIYDAINAGFGKIVFVIRNSFEKDFNSKIVSKYNKKINVELVFQELENLPKGFELNPDREKPWGTNHAVMMGKDVIKEPFAVINADDYYGQESFKILYDFLSNVEHSTNKYCMVAYRLGNTLSESGTVARGVCEKDNNNFLTSIVERTQIKRIDGIIKYKDENDNWIETKENTPVSMNMWGFTTDYFNYSEDQFTDFLNNSTHNLKAEYFIPLVVNNLIKDKTVTVEVLDTPSKWFGVTYKEDKQYVIDRLQKLSDEGVYKSPIW